MNIFNRDKNKSQNTLRCFSARKKKLDMSKLRYEMLLLRVKDLKHKIFIRNKKEQKLEKEKKKKEENWQSSYWNINKIIRKFFRNDNKSDNPFNYNINLQKQKIDLSSKNYTKNPIYLKNVHSLYDSSKSKIENKNKNDFDEGLDEIKNKLKKIKKKINVLNLSSSKKSTISIDYDSEKSKSPTMRNVFKKTLLSDRINEKKVLSKKNLLNEKNNNSNIKFTPRNYSAKSILKSPKEEIKKPKVIHKPIIKYKAEDILSDFYKIKNNIKYDKLKFRSNPLIHNKSIIDSVLDNIEEMKIFQLKEKFIKLLYNHNPKKKIMSLSDFVDKLKEQCEEIDDPFN